MWAKNSLKDPTLALQLREIRTAKLNGDNLRKAITDITKKRFTELSKQLQTASALF